MRDQFYINSINNMSPNPGYTIYCTILIPYSWTFVFNSFVTLPDHEALHQSFHWNGTFTYAYDDSDTITTDPVFSEVTIVTLILNFFLVNYTISICPLQMMWE